MFDQVREQVEGSVVPCLPKEGLSCELISRLVELALLLLPV